MPNLYYSEYFEDYLKFINFMNIVKKPQNKILINENEVLA